jgi:phage terminase large subunit-like protein
MRSRRGELLGIQHPRVEHLPRRRSETIGPDATQLVSDAGLFLDPWQQYVLDIGLATRANKTYAAREVGLIVSRQNGKGSILETLAVAKALIMDEPLILWTAHEFATALEGFRRLRDLIEASETPNDRGIAYLTGEESYWDHFHV